MLNTLRLKNFKGWEDTGILRLAPITVFFGTNSSGKTSLIQSLLLLKQTAASTDRSRVLYPGDDRSLVDLGTISDLTHGHALNNAIEITLSWTVPKQDVERAKELAGIDTLGFTVIVRSSEKGDVHVESASYSFGTNEVALVSSDEPGTYDLVGDGLKRKRGRPWPLPPPIRFYGFPDEVVNYYQNAAWVADLALALEKELARIHYVGPLREYPKRVYLWAGEKPENVGTRGGLAIAAMLAANADERTIRHGTGKGTRYTSFGEVIANWLRLMGMIESFRLSAIAKNRKEYEVLVKRTVASPEVFITDVGFGVSQLLPVLVQSYYALPNETVIFEQPEIHLHPRVQADLADVLIDASASQNVQFVVESHSEHFLRRLQRRVAEATNITKDDVALYFCEVVEGKSIVAKLEVDEDGNIHNWPRDFFGDEMGDRAAMLKASLARRKQR